MHNYDKNTDESTGAGYKVSAMVLVVLVVAAFIFELFN